MEFICEVGDEVGRQAKERKSLSQLNNYKQKKRTQDTKKKLEEEKIPYMAYIVWISQHSNHLG